MKDMTNEQAKSELMQIYGMLSEEKKQALDVLMAQADGDLISRQQARSEYADWYGYGYQDNWFYKRLGSMPSVDIPPAEPKTGHWIDIDEEPHEVWECDHCGFVIDGSGCIDPYDYRDTYKFCPNCGCRMFEPQESEE